MRLANFFRTGLALLLCCTIADAQRPSAAPAQPKLILVIVVDQFRQDYTTRFRGEYTSGLKQMLTRGAVFVDAHQDHFPTVTAVGHTTILTGSVPATSGIIGNEWYDRGTGKVITSVEDPAVTVVGDAHGSGASPHNLIVSTVGDELKIVHGAESHVIGLSMKDRAAILTVGRMADAAFWFDAKIGGFVTSSWYRSSLPEWLQAFNAAKLPEASLGKAWVSSSHAQAPPFVQLPQTAGPAFFAAWSGTPYANEVLEQLAETTLRSENLGHHAATDVLSVSFSANDAVGHRVGPDAAEVEDMSVQTDRIIGKLLNRAAIQAGGVQNLLVVFTADHGVAPVPEVNAQRKLPGQRIAGGLLDPVRQGLRAKFGAGDWILADTGSMLYLNKQLIAQKGVSEDAVEEETARLCAELPGVLRVYTRKELARHIAMQSTIDDYIARGFFAPRSGDVYFLMQPYSLGGTSGTSHGTPYNYDSHVPLIFYGWRVKPGTYVERVGVSDIAPTLAAILRIETPSGSVGHILPQVTSTAAATPSVP